VLGGALQFELRTGALSGEYFRYQGTDTSEQRETLLDIRIEQANPSSTAEFTRSGRR
jgi:hypothetical protein